MENNARRLARWIADEPGRNRPGLEGDVGRALDMAWYTAMAMLVQIIVLTGAIALGVALFIEAVT